MLTFNMCVWLYVFNAWPVAAVFFFLLLAVVLVAASLGHTVAKFLYEEARPVDSEPYSTRRLPEPDYHEIR